MATIVETVGSRAARYGHRGPNLGGLAIAAGISLGAVYLLTATPAGLAVEAEYYYEEGQVSSSLRSYAIGKLKTLQKAATQKGDTSLATTIGTYISTLQGLGNTKSPTTQTPKSSPKSSPKTGTGSGSGTSGGSGSGSSGSGSGGGGSTPRAFGPGTPPGGQVVPNTSHLSTGPSTSSRGVTNPGPVAGPPASGTYVVKSGQNLSVISKALYGSAAFWPALYCWNQKMIGSNPNLIHAGQSLFYYKAGTGMAKKATAAYYANGGKCA